MTSIWSSIVANPVKLAGALRAIILCAVSFGLRWTPEQIGATMLAVEAVLGIFTVQTTTPNSKVDTSVTVTRTSAPEGGTTVKTVDGEVTKNTGGTV